MSPPIKKLVDPPSSSLPGGLKIPPKKSEREKIFSAQDWSSCVSLNVLSDR
jgi:hypothetical protein